MILPSPVIYHEVQTSQLELMTPQLLRVNVGQIRVKD